MNVLFNNFVTYRNCFNIGQLGIYHPGTNPGYTLTTYYTYLTDSTITFVDAQNFSDNPQKAGILSLMAIVRINKNWGYIVNLGPQPNRYANELRSGKWSGWWQYS